MDEDTRFGRITQRAKFFAMSYHKNEEVAIGTLNNILKKSGIKL